MKKAFSLIELLIVIVIVGVVYTLAITNIQNIAKGEMTPSLENLETYLQSYIKDGVKRSRLLCLDDCSECSVYVDGRKVQTLESFFDESVEIYRYDILQGFMRKKEAVFFNEEDVQESVCFSFETFHTGVSEQLVVVYGDKVYDYTGYFEKTAVYDSLETLLEHKENLAQKVMQ